MPGRSVRGAAGQREPTARPGHSRVFLACFQPGDTILGMDLCTGGHLHHGSPGECVRQVVQGGHYGVSPTQLWGFCADPSLPGHAKLIICGYRYPAR